MLMNHSVMNSKLELKHNQIPYHITGNQQKETLLMLHPAFTDHQIFAQQVEYFEEDYQILLIDMPGHGRSQIKGSTVILKDMPEIIHEILLANNISSCHVLGVSLGSLVAQAFADRYPNQVRSVIILGGYSIHKANARVLKAQGKEGLKWLLYILFSMKKFKRYATTVSCYTDSGRERFSQGNQYITRKSFLAMSGTKSFFIKKDSPMPYPLLIVVGEHDLQLVHEVAMEWHELEPSSQLVLLRGAGHCANVDTPKEFNEIVAEFLEIIKKKLVPQ
ncbi:MAG: alpha/beta fold hydrolase [Paenibacillus sp.]|nr:alpha/beta fold hydrolase [Paenibacillus sp.]